jgi:hypothetical protein
LTTPRSTSEITGISGSGISPSASQTAASADRRRPPHHRHLVPELGELLTRCRPLDRLGRRPAEAVGESGTQCGLQHAERVWPQLFDCRRVTLLVAEPLQPHLGVKAVVELLPLDLRRDPGQLRILVALERLDSNRVRRLVENVARDRARPVRDEPQLHERCAAVFLRCAVEGERVGVGAELGRGEVVESARVTDLVLRDRGEGDVLLEERGDPGPLGVAPAEDQLVVGKLEEQLSPRPCLRVHAPPSAAP